MDRPVVSGPLAAARFDEICAAPEVRERVATSEEVRRAAVRRFMLTMPLVLVGSIAAGWAVTAVGLPDWGWIVGVLLLVFGAIAAARPLGEAGEAIKHPVLEEIARGAGLEYLPDGFHPPAFAGASQPLFGGRLSQQGFTDLFHGKDEEGRGHAFYEACLQRRAGRSTQTVFRGQIYAFERRLAGAGEIAIVPDRGILNFIKPKKGMERVPIDSDEEFERRFEVYATDPLQARQLLVRAGVRQALMELRAQAKAMAWIGPGEVLIAVPGRDRYEPGSMWRARGGEERARLMYDDVCESLALLAKLKRAFG